MKRTLVLVVGLFMLLGTVVYAQAPDNEIITETTSNSTTLERDTQEGNEDALTTDGDDSVYRPESKAQGPASETEDYTGGLFYKPKLDVDMSYADPINEKIYGFVGVFLLVVVNLFPALLIAQTVIDVSCIMLTPAGWFFGILMPVRLFSKEVTELTGLVFAGDGDAGAAQPIDLKGKSRMTMYMSLRGRDIIISSIVVVLTVTMFFTGLWQVWVSAAVNWILGFMPN